jgi:hypothetical protein
MTDAYGASFEETASHHEAHEGHEGFGSLFMYFVLFVTFVVEPVLLVYRSFGCDSAALGPSWLNLCLFFRCGPARSL